MLNLELRVNNLIFTGWQEISVVRTIRAMSGAFRLQFTDSWEVPVNKQKVRGWSIKPGDECEVIVEGQTLITGYVDVLETSLSAQTRQISVVGRDKTADLADCSYDNNQFEFQSITFKNLVKTLTSKFGVGLQTEKQINDVLPLNTAVNPGETVYHTLEKHARKFGVQFATDGKGNLLVIDTSKAALLDTSLEQGINVEAISVRYDHTERFSKYTVFGQRPPLDDYVVGQARQATGIATDPRITRFRPMIVNGEEKMDASQAQKRAQWEATVRAARSQQVIVTIPSWFQGDSAGNKTTKLWEVNKFVRVKSPACAVDDDLLIAEVEFQYAEGTGEQATLTLYPPYAFAPQPTVPVEEDPEDDLDDE